MQWLKKLPIDTSLIVSPFIKELKNYQFSFIKNDLLAALSIAFLAIPQSIAYTLIAGLPWQAGLIATILGAMISSLFCSGRFMVAGPTTAGSILIGAVLTNVLSVYFPDVHGEARDRLIITILMQIIFVVGILQLLISIFKLSRVLEFVSRSVLLGYFLGISISLIISQLYYFLGLQNHMHSTSLIYSFWNLILHLKEIDFVALSFGLLSFSILHLLKNRHEKIPVALLLLIGMSFFAAFVNYFFHLKAFSIEDMSQGLGKNLDVYLQLPPLDFSLIANIFPSILAICFLMILEVFSTTKAVSLISKHDLNVGQEVYSMGMSNLFLSFWSSGMPVSVSFSRSIINMQTHPKSRWAPFLSGLLVILVVFFLWPLIKQVPIAVLAALLLSMVSSFIKKEEIKLCFQASMGDTLAFLLTAISCLFFNLDVAFFIGVGISVAYYIKHSSLPHFVEYAFNDAGKLTIVTEHQHRKVRILGIEGDLFFASADLFFQNTIHKVEEDLYVKSVVLRLQGVRYVDASICFALLKLHDYLTTTNRTLILSGVASEVWDVLKRTQIADKIGKNNIFLAEETHPHISTWRAYQYARELSLY